MKAVTATLIATLFTVFLVAGAVRKVIEMLREPFWLKDLRERGLINPVTLWKKISTFLLHALPGLGWSGLFGLLFGSARVAVEESFWFGFAVVFVPLVGIFAMLSWSERPWYREEREKWEREEREKREREKREREEQNKREQEKREREDWEKREQEKREREDWEKVKAIVALKTDPPRKQKYVYVISHPNYPGQYKVGIADDWERRLSSYQTGDPGRQYHLEFKFLTPWFRETEQHIHDKFPNKHEWVKGDLNAIIGAIKTHKPIPHTQETLEF